ncbi:MAG: hypothetical protein IPL64_15030 [Flavobacteriales bacterium]|nr:hypothetical protein [Flavobacteriales bacterium]
MNSKSIRSYERKQLHECRPIPVLELARPRAFSRTASASNAEFIAAMDKKVPQWLEEFIVPGVALAIIEDGKVTFRKEK